MEMSAADALKSYRTHSGVQFQEAVKSFLELKPEEQNELLFYLIMNTNTQMGKLLDFLNVPYEANKEPMKAN